MWAKPGKRNRAPWAHAEKDCNACGLAEASAALPVLPADSRLVLGEPAAA